MKNNIQSGFLKKAAILIPLYILFSINQIFSQCAVTPDFEISEQYCDSIVFNNKSTPMGLVDSVKWIFGDGNSIVQTIAPFDTTHLYTYPDTFDVKLVIWDNTLCTDTATKTLIIENPIVGFWADTVCFGSQTHLHDTSKYNIASWLWKYDDGGTDNIKNPTHLFNSAGTHDVKLIVTNDLGCVDSTNHDILVGGFPVADFNITFGCPSDTTFFSDISVSNADSIINWSWDLGSGLNPSLSPDTFNIYPTGAYNITLEVENNYGCIDDTTRQITIESPVAGFWADTSCFGFETHLYDTSTYNKYPIESWLWELDGGTTYSVQYPAHLYSVPGIDTVKLIVTNSIGCTDSIENPVVVDTLPVADFSFSIGCVGLETCFFDESKPNADSIILWFWNFGDGGTSTEQNPCHVFYYTGDFEIKLIVVNSNGCPSAFKIDTLTVNDSPLPVFTADAICFNDSTVFKNETDTSGIGINFWEWNFDDPGSGANNTSGLMNPKHLFSQEGSFDVKLIAGTVNGCVDSVVNQVIVDSLPEAIFTLPDTIAVGVEFTIIENSIPHGTPFIVEKFWDFGDGNTAYNINPVTHTYDTAGVFNICLVVTDDKGCTDTLCQTIVVTALPYADFTYYYSTIDSIVYFFDDSYPDSTIVEWFWQFGDLTSELDTSSYKDYHWKYPSEGFYSVNLWIKDSRGGEHDTTKTIYAGNAIVSDFQHEDVCLGDTVMFIDQSFNQIPVVYDQWEWVFGDGQGVTYYEKTDTVSHYYDTAGVYNVYFITTASVNEIQITDTIMKDIYVYNPPVARIDSLGYTAYCVDGNIQFIDSSYTIDSDSVTSWLWDFGDGVTDTVQNPVHKYNEIDTVWTTLVVNTSFGCQSIDSVEVRLTDSPDISFIWENPCVNSPMHFIPDSSNVPVTYWEWNFGDPGSPDNIIIDSSKYSDPTHVYTEVNNYRVTMIAKSENCEKEVLSESFLIKPIPYSTFSVTPNFNNVQGQTKFENNSFDPNTTIPLNYFWDFGNGETSTIENPIEVYEKDSTYTITLISYNEYNCADTSWYELLVFFKGLYFPTAFSPNNPNEEISLFTPRGINLREYLIQVFDMKGNLMWESEELDENGSPVESWDGYYNGLLMPQGMYVWRAEAIFRDGTIWKGSDFQAENPQPYGTVTLVR